MKVLTIIASTTLFILTAIMISYSASQFVEIKKPFVSIYEYLDPKSEILVQAAKNDHFELIYEGTAWYQVKVKDKVGWVEKSAGTIVTNPGYSFFSIPLGTLFFFLLLLIATITGASFLIYKQKTAEL
jgi:hypothetical protein